MKRIRIRARARHSLLLSAQARHQTLQDYQVIVSRVGWIKKWAQHGARVCTITLAVADTKLTRRTGLANTISKKTPFAQTGGGALRQHNQEALSLSSLNVWPKRHALDGTGAKDVKTSQRS